MNPLLPENPYLVASAIGSTDPFIEVFETRAPTPNDTNHTIQKRWLNKLSGMEYMLIGFTSAGGLLQAIWIPLGGISNLKFGVPFGSSPVTGDANGLLNFTSNDNSVVITGSNGGLGMQSINFAVSGTTNAIQRIILDDGSVTPTGSPNSVTMIGATVNNATNAKPLFFNQVTSSTAQIEIQVASAVAPSPVNANAAGIVSLNANQFSVNPVTGFVSLLGSSGSAIQTLTGQDNLPVSPTTGNIGLQGTTVPFGTHNVPLFFRRLSTSVEALDIQIATVVTPTPGVNTNCGICCFNDEDFVIDIVSGMVSLSGGSSGAIQTLTGDVGGAVNPTAANINLLGQSTPNRSGIKVTASPSTLNFALSSPAYVGDFLFANDTSMTPIDFAVLNQASSAVSTARIAVAVVSTSLADAYFICSVNAVSNFVLGIDNSDNDNFKICYNSTAKTPSDDFLKMTIEASDTGVVAMNAPLAIGAVSGPQIVSGSANPNGSVTAPAGSIYLRTAGTITVYVNQNGATTWTALT